MDKPTLFFCVGLVASGKSTWAETHKDKLNAIIHSSDEIRTELLNDVNDQSKNELVFATLHKRVKEDLRDGKNVIYDATSLSRKKRVNFIQNELRDIPCEKICVLFATPIEICKVNNANRERKVPEEVLEKMIRSFEVLCPQEGWDNIQIVWWDYKKDGFEFNLTKDLDEWRRMPHDNPHHTKTIGDHMIAASAYYAFNIHEPHGDKVIWNKLLSWAIHIHDCGKPFTKSFFDKDGNISEKARYYQHHNVGSYLSLFYLKEIRECGIDDNAFDLTDNDILYISLLINCHMRHFMAYKDSEKARERDRKLFGDDFMRQLDILHECDLAAH